MGSVTKVKKLFELLLICICFHWKLPPVNAEDMKPSRMNNSTVIDEMAVKMVTSCYANFTMALIHGNFDLSTIGFRGESKYVDAIMISNMSKINVGYEQRRTMSLFFITPNSVQQSDEMLMKFKHSPLWNIMNPLFILDRSNCGCENARDILKSTWKMNVVKTFFLCVDSSQTSMIYTYNPYTNRAPPLWKEVPSTETQANGWTMYVQSQYEGGGCEALNFDRTEYIDGSVVRVVTTLPKHHTWIPDMVYNESIMEKMYKRDVAIAKIMKHALNVTLVFNIDEVGYAYGGHSEGFYGRLQNGSSDIALCLRSSPANGNFTTTYPAARSKYYIVTNNRGFYTPWEKIQNYYGIVALISMCIILSATFIVIVCSGIERRWSFSGFELLRLIVNVAIRSHMNTLSRRIFFAMIFLYFLIIHATFRGHLSASLTKDEYRKNVESLEDLKDSRYTAVHISVGAVPIIEDPLLKSKLIVGHPNCPSKILGKDSEACIADILFLHDVVFREKLHLSKKSVGRSEYSYAVREDWPLKKRFDTVLKRLEQSGITRRWDEEYLKTEKAWQARSKVTTQVNFRPISLAMFEFAYLILAIGLIAATVCLLFEKLIRELSLWMRQ